MNKTIKTISIFAAGAAAGALLGILLAPDKGSETRKKISGSKKKLFSKLEEEFNHMKNKLSGHEENKAEKTV